MILVLLGTQDSPFPRILKETEEAIHRLRLPEKVYAQTGTTVYQSNLIEIHEYFLGEEYQNMLGKARIIITHGGAGTMFDAIHLGKKIIVLPRLAELGEHNESHQGELVRKLADLGLVYEARQGITRALIAMEKFIPKPYNLSNNLIEAITNFIEN